MGNEGGKKKVTIAALASILLVAAVVGTVIGVSGKKGGDGDNASSAGGIITSTKAAALCSPTDFKETCEQSLAGANTTDTKELIKLAFNAAVKNISDVIKNSNLLKEAAKDESIKGALDVCDEVLERSIEDFKRSIEKVDEFDLTKLDNYVEDLTTWLGATVTYQETCIDAFENTTGDTGEKMKKLLKFSRELSVNALAMIEKFKSIIPTLQLGGFSGSRRLLSREDQDRILYGGDPTDYAPGEDPHWKKSAPALRRLLSREDQDRILYGGDPTDYAPGEDPHWKKSNPQLRRLLAASPASLNPKFVVAQDGSTPYKTIQSAVNALPKKNPTNETLVIFVKAGIYKEIVTIPKIHHIMLIGEGPEKTRISNNKNFAAGVKTFHSATLAVNGEDFVCKDIAIENTAGYEGHQAVAVRVSGDKAVFQNVHIDGYQDTLYAHNYRQYYRDCTISGTIDFVFGDAQSLFQNCKFVVRKPGPNQRCMVTAQGRAEKRLPGGIFIQNGTFTAEPALLTAQPPVEAYLGRPWKNFSRTIVMESHIDEFISPEGWYPWQGSMFLDTLYYGEYQNRGPGANMAKRVTWKGIQKITPQLAESFTGGKQFATEATDEWIRKTGVPYVPTLMKI